MIAIKALRRQQRKRQRDIVMEFLVFTLPLLVFLLILYGTLAWNFYVSTGNWVSTAPDYTFTGLKWYRYLFHQSRFWIDVQNNLKWLILGVLPTVAAAIFLAYLLELAPFPGIESYVRTLILYPVAMSFVVTGTIWSWLYQPEKGVFNTILASLGIHSPFTYTNDPDHGHLLVDPDLRLAVPGLCRHHHPVLVPHYRAAGDGRSRHCGRGIARRASSSRSSSPTSARASWFWSRSY